MSALISSTNNATGESALASQIDKPEVLTKLLLESRCSWIRSALVEPYYRREQQLVRGSSKLEQIQDRFERELVQRAQQAKSAKEPFQFPPRKPPVRPIKHCMTSGHGSSCSSSEDFSDDDSDGKAGDEEEGGEEEEEEDSAYEELQRKKTHPWRLHEELWYNDEGEMNDGPLCRCSAKARKTGIRHGIYPGESPLPPCDLNSDNQDRLFHYRLLIKPLTNFTTKFPTTISYDNHDFVFEGFSLLSHQPLKANYPPCKLIRFNIEYEITLQEEKFPTNFTVRDLDLLSQFIFHEILELEDLDWRAYNDHAGCPRFHVYPRFARLLEEQGKEFLSLHAVLNHLIKSSTPLIQEVDLQRYGNMSEGEWIEFATQHKGMIVTLPGMKPSSIRVDQLDRETDDLNGGKIRQQELPHTLDGTCDWGDDESIEVENGCSDMSMTSSPDMIRDNRLERPQCDDWPIIVHFGIRPPQLSYAGNPKYQKTWRDFVKYRHLLANKPKVTFEEKQLLLKKEEKLQEMRLKSDLKRDCTVTISTKGFMRTGIFCDVIQHALVLPVIVCHLRFHDSLNHLENEVLDYNFKDRYLLQLALTHPSYRENFGTNADHARNSLTNCGIRQPHYGDRKVHFMNTRKRGINMLINIMSRFGHNRETASSINHNERLEFLGDAVVEFLTSIHLYHIFPDLEEGGLATYRAAIVQNQHLALLAKNLQLNRYMLYAHGSDLCHDLELKHAMANCFEALIGALFLDGGINVADQVFSETLFWVGPANEHAGGCCHDSGAEHHKHLLNVEENKVLKDIWIHYNRHPIQMQEPDGDRHHIEKIPRLQKLIEFEDMTGIEFTHVRLLARAFTHRSVGFNHLTLGSNQRMEFLGDTVLQLIASEYLYKFFPEHHEGHLSLLRSSLVNNKTQAVVCDDLGMTKFAVYNYAKGKFDSIPFIRLMSFLVQQANSRPKTGPICWKPFSVLCTWTRDSTFVNVFARRVFSLVWNISS